MSGFNWALTKSQVSCHSFCLDEEHGPVYHEPMRKNTSGFKEFVKAALKDPKSVSTIFPTMRFLAQSLIHHSGMGPGHHVLELGSGSGAITRFILEDREQLGSYTGVEIDNNLIQFLQKQYPGERFLAASADDLSAHIPSGSIDVVISSLPWTMFPKELQEAIVQEILRVLKPGGRFTTFLCLHALTYPSAPRAKKYFAKYFTGFEKKETITRNIPPANVYLGSK